MKQCLVDEIAMVAQNQEFMAKQFHNEVLDEARNVNDAITNLRQLIQSDYNEGPNKSFLKSTVDEYEACMPLLDMDKLEELLKTDLDVVKGTAQRAKVNLKIVSANFEKFMQQ